jgi:molybdate transport system permease protein
VTFTASELDAIRLSAVVALWCTLAVLPVATALGWLLARRDFRGKLLLDAAVHLPLVIPPVVTGYLLLILLGRNGPLGRLLEDWLGIVVAFRWTGAVIASAVMALPLAVRAIRVAFEAVDRDLERSAASLGAGPWRSFFRVSLPLALPGLIAGAILAFAKSLGEFGATITFVSNIPGETQTIPTAIYTYMQVPGSEWQVLRLTIVAVALSFLALLASEIFARRALRYRERPARNARA